MTKQEAIDNLKREQESDDIEIAHANADGVLCQLLTSLGFKKVVEEYNKIHKWYA